VARVRSAIDNYEPRRDKMGLMRLLAREGVQKFDVDSFFMSLAATAR